MYRYVGIILLLVGANVWADKETIEPDADEPPSDWSNVGGASKTASVTDAVDGNYVWEITDEQNQQFTLSNTTFDAGATVDSFHIISFMRDDGTGNNKAQMVAVTDASNYCLGADVALGTSYAVDTSKFTGAPSGADACGGTLTKAVMDALKVRVDATAIGGGRAVYCTKIYVDVYYTPAAAGGGQTGRRRKLLVGE